MNKININTKGRESVQVAIYLTINGLTKGKSYKYQNHEIISQNISYKMWYLINNETKEKTLFNNPEKAAMAFLNTIWIM